MLVDSPVLCMLESPARRSFKRAAGHDNHFLITVHVGLAAVQAGTAKLPPEMRVGWDPRDREASAERSRGFANKAALAWTIDTLEAYLDFLRVEPHFASQDIREGLQGAIGREEGIAGKIRSAAKEAGQRGPLRLYWQRSGLRGGIVLSTKRRRAKLSANLLARRVAAQNTTSIFIKYAY